MSVKLESSDGVQFTVEKNVIELSLTVRHLLEDLDGADSDLTVPIPSVKGKTLEKIIEWCKYHTANPDEPVPECDKYRTDNIIPWDRDFMQVDMALLFDIVIAANYMDIKGLLELSLKTIANYMKGKTVEEIKVLFAMPTPAAK